MEKTFPLLNFSLVLPPVVLILPLLLQMIALDGGFF